MFNQRSELEETNLKSKNAFVFRISIYKVDINKSLMPLYKMDVLLK